MLCCRGVWGTQSPGRLTPTLSSFQFICARLSTAKFPGSGEMSDSGVVPYPQVFVVDGQASCVTVPTGKKARWSGMGQKILLILMGLAMLGLVVQASLIYNLYRKVEVRYHIWRHSMWFFGVNSI